MDERLLNLLRIVVEEHVATAEPVGSQALVERYKLDVSPATIRNWFADLEAHGLLMQPHTSGGRIPTEKGFKTYLDRFIEEKPANKRDRDAIEKAALLPKEDGRRLKNVAKGLAELSGLSVFLGLGEADTFYTGLSQLFAQPEFKDSQRVVNLSEILDHLDEALAQIRHRPYERPHILIGQDCPFGPSCGIVVVTHDTELIGVLGPLRMDYQYTYSLLNAALAALTNA